jgi:hypothetical protein
MANSKISALTSATTPLAGTETLPIVQSGVTKQVSVANLTAGRDINATSITTTARSSFNGGGVYIGNTSSFGTSSAAVSIFNGGASANYFKGDATYWQNASGTQMMELVSGNLTNNIGNYVPATAAKGINFTANTPAAGMTSQLLNWYEQGTWTPALSLQSGSVTYTTQTGTYTRVGRLVTVQAYIKIATVSSPSGFLLLTGLPFTPNRDNQGAASIMVNTVLVVVLGTWAAYPRSAGDIRLWTSTTALNNPAANLQAASEIWITCSYEV